MFRMLIYSSLRACDYSVELPHWSSVLGSMCVGVSVWLGWSGIRVASFSLQHFYSSTIITTFAEPLGGTKCNNISKF